MLHADTVGLVFAFGALLTLKMLVCFQRMHFFKLPFLQII